MIEREEVLQEFGVTNPPFEAEYAMADAIVRLRATAPRVVVLDEWRVVDKDGVEDDVTGVAYQREKAFLSASWCDKMIPKGAPHRVVRVALVEEATTPNREQP